MNQQTKDLPPFDMDPAMLESLSGMNQAGSLVPVKKGDVTVYQTGEYISAQKVAVERDLAKIMGRIKVLAAAAGARWYYSIPFKNRKTGQTEYVEGLTIKGANSVFRQYGNCALSVKVQDSGTHWIITPRFADLESGSNYERPFQQRKSQDTGMADGDRRSDMVFQIGVSKASRNVINNALEDLCTFAFEESKKGIAERIGKNPEGARKWIAEQLAELKIDVKRVEAVRGRSVANWTARDMAAIYGEINSLLDNMATAEEMYPPVDSAPEIKPDPPKATVKAAPAPPQASAPAAESKPVGMPYAEVAELLKNATTADAFDYARSFIKNFGEDQAAELSALASQYYDERFGKKDKPKAAVKAEPAKSAGEEPPPLFG